MHVISLDTVMEIGDEQRFESWSFIPTTRE